MQNLFRTNRLVFINAPEHRSAPEGASESERANKAAQPNDPKEAANAAKDKAANAVKKAATSPKVDIGAVEVNKPNLTFSVARHLKNVPHLNRIKDKIANYLVSNPLRPNESKKMIVPVEINNENGAVKKDYTFVLRSTPRGGTKVTLVDVKNSTA